jgi:hypothetical protein
MHHDALATAYLTIAFYLAARVRDPRRTIARALAVGFLLGWTITTSMLSFFPVLVSSSTCCPCAALRGWHG